MILWKNKQLYIKGQRSRDDRLEARSLDNRRHKTQGEAVPERLGEPGVPGERRP